MNQKSPEKKKKYRTLGTNVPPSLYDSYRRMADKTERPISFFVLKALKEYRENHYKEVMKSAFT